MSYTRRLYPSGTKVLRLAQATASYLSNSNDRTQVSECKNMSKSDIVFEWYCITNIITNTDANIMLAGIIVFANHRYTNIDSDTSINMDATLTLSRGQHNKQTRRLRGHTYQSV